MREGDTLSETFTYRMHDTAGRQRHGADHGGRRRAHGTRRWRSTTSTWRCRQLLGGAGLNPTGNVLANDTDVDRADSTSARVAPGPTSIP